MIGSVKVFAAPSNNPPDAGRAPGRRKHSPNPSVPVRWFPSSSLGTDVCPLVAPNREVPKLELGNQGSSL